MRTLEYVKGALGYGQKPDYREGEPAPTPEEALRKMGMEECIPEDGELEEGGQTGSQDNILDPGYNAGPLEAAGSDD